MASHGSRIAVYQLDAKGELAHRTADYVIGEPSLYGRRNSPGYASRSEGSIMSGFAYDNVNHRLFVRDRAVNAWQPDGRILVVPIVSRKTGRLRTVTTKRPDRLIATPIGMSTHATVVKSDSNRSRTVIASPRRPGRPTPVSSAAVPLPLATRHGSAAHHFHPRDCFSISRNDLAVIKIKRCFLLTGRSGRIGKS